jgi:hypothetical protein
MRTPLNIVAFLFAILLTLSTDTRAQLAIRSENQFLYNEALRVSLESMNREWGEFDLTEHGTRAPIDFHNMIVRKDPAITDGLNSRFGEYRVTYLDDASLIGRWKRLRKQFALLYVGPVNRSEGRLKITISLVWISYRRSRQVFFALDSWANVYFRFDAANRKYVVDNVELAGV